MGQEFSKFCQSISEKALEMLPLTASQTQEFIQRYLGEEGDRLFQQLQGERLQKFAETPLLLWMLCRVFAQNGKVPNNLGLAFREFAQLHDQKLQEDAPTDSKDEWHRLLRRLAFVMMQGKTLIDPQLSIPKEEVEDCLTKYLQQIGRSNPREDAERGLKDLLKYHLIQSVIQPNLEEHIEFRHQLIQEYYAAEHLLRLLPNITDEQLTQNYLNYLKWTEPIALMLALIGDEKQALQVIKLALDVDLWLGARLAGEVKEEFQQKSLNIVNQTIADNNFPDWMTVAILGQIQTEQSKQCLVKYLNHQEIKIVRKACRFIGETSDFKVIDIIFSRLEDVEKNFLNHKFFGGSDQIGELWAMLTESLSYLQPQKVIYFLRERLIEKKIKNWYFLHQFTKAPQLLMRLDGESVLLMLLEDLKRLQNDSKKPMPPDFFNKSPDSFIRSLIMSSPDRIKKEYQNAFDNDKSLIFNLISCSSNYESVVDALIQALENEESINSKKQIIKLISNSHHDQINKILIRQLSHPNFKVKAEACQQLINRNQKNPDVINDLMQLLDHENWEVAWSAAFVLGSLGHEHSICKLTEAMQTEAKKYKYTVLHRMTAKALSNLNSQLTAPILIKFIDENHQKNNECCTGIVWESAFSLSKLGCPEAIPVLLKAAQSGLSKECKEAIQGLARLGEVEHLQAILKSKSVGWQTAAIELVDLEENNAFDDLISPLQQALIEPDTASSNKIIEMLSKLAGSETIDWLIDALKNPYQHTHDQFFANRVAFVLSRANLDILQKRLTDLKQLITNHHIEQLFWLIPTIQNRCQFYNYEIYQAHLIAQQADRQASQKSDRPSSNPVTYDLRNATIGNFAHEVHGNQITKAEERS
ncbi:HEAT repeat domain-containing protein [Spirulina major]|uniref:HEAT repeat domain-containing protein n=1 Tax=Spirulina major TaxID=270636 RepID=UPI001587AF44|nr:HEAT repeat domain-containing protein [Spirulina major]